MSLNIKEPMAVTAASAVCAVQPLCQRMEEHHAGQGLAAAANGQQSTSSGSHGSDEPSFMPEDLHAVERPAADEREDEEQGRQLAVDEVDSARIAVAWLDARQARVPKLTLTATAAPVMPGRQTLPSQGADSMPATGDASTPVIPAPVPATRTSPVHLPTSGQTLTTTSPVTTHAPPGTVPSPSPAVPPPAAPTPVGAGEVAAAAPPASTVPAVPVAAASTMPAPPPPAPRTESSERGTASRESNTPRVQTVRLSAVPTGTVPGATASREAVTGPDHHPIPGPAVADDAMAPAVSTHAQKDAAQVPASQGSQTDAGQARTEAGFVVRKQVQQAQQMTRLIETLASRSRAETSVHVAYASWGPGHSVTARQPLAQPGQLTLQASSLRVAQALSSAERPDGLDLTLVVEGATAETETATDADERRQRQRGRDHA